MEKMTKEPGRKNQAGRPLRDITLIRRVVQQYHQGNQSCLQLAKTHGLTKSQVKNWVARYSSDIAIKDPLPKPMTDEEKKEMQALQEEVKLLKKKLEHEQMKNFALDTMIDLAKEQYDLDLRKNSGAKQPNE
jgi:transposase-like protein